MVARVKILEKITRKINQGLIHKLHAYLYFLMLIYSFLLAHSFQTTIFFSFILGCTLLF
jgi:hypothetical protein